MNLGIALEGFFFEKVNGSTGQRITFTFHYIIYAPASRHTAAKGTFCFAATASKSLIRAKGTFCCTASRRVVGVCRWTSELPLRGSFSKRSTGHFFGHYIIYDSRRHHADQSETTPLQKVHGVFCSLDG